MLGVDGVVAICVNGVKRECDDGKEIGSSSLVSNFLDSEFFRCFAEVLYAVVVLGMESGGSVGDGKRCCCVFMLME